MKTLKLAPIALLTLFLLTGCAARQQTSLPDEIEQAEETEAVLGADQPRHAGQEDRAKPQAKALARESDLSDHQIAALKQSLGKDAFDQTGAGSWSELPGLTAAHATLPVGSKVEVTNLDNSRRAVVMITDRNPKDGRLIEVSRSAAEQLGMTGSNTAQVGLRVLDRPRGKAAKAAAKAAAAAAKKPKAAPARKPTRVEEDENAVSPEDRITADEAEGRVSAPKAASKSKSSKTKAAQAKAQPTPAKTQAKAKVEPAAAKTKTPAPAKAQTAPTATGGRYYVQVGSFSSKANAEALVKRLKAQGYGNSRMAESRKDGKTLYRVQAGAFADKARAGAAQGALKGEFPSSYVVSD
ncbi:SPOR domain-containing protein [Desulfovibrio aminophilus]|uniref:septal ring lytic transglycosylase RlpA family protein n=1 Tax=Desulfovibrio aminophilus TaxID=81425 RepID=UPI003393D559